ncbi:glucan endo-1,3-beta-glucosidase-like [Salvia miltiorrhiza]|uniref:glucan endo-1,3-beta-glucosidase-like n=1 Tax=Salvia miltiorrhiza TaxID=226208 RepID=UPI0025AD99BE|nr:glucan endo-1,3-beta-glucosidase-like [Salvia miltiorrhiza]
MKLSLFIVIFQLGLVISYVAADSTISDAVIHQSKTWCVVTVGAADEKLQAFLESTCSELNCKAIRAGGSCYQPNTLQNHASYVLNLFYRARGVCNSQIGTPSINDPSFGRCIYS